MEPDVLSDMRQLSEPKINGGTLYRLRSEINGRLVSNADEFVADLARSPFISELAIGDSRFRLYGVCESGGIPSFSEFLRQFPEYVDPETSKFGYVVIVSSGAVGSTFYALIFGILGRHLLNDDFVDMEAAREIGRVETLATDDGSAPQVRQVRSRRIGENPLRIQRKPSRPSTFGYIALDPYFEIIDEVIGTPRNASIYGKTLSAGTGLSVRRELSLQDIATMSIEFEASLERARADTAAGGNRMTSVKDAALIELLDTALLQLFLEAQPLGPISFSIPDFIRPDDPVEVHFTRLGRGARVFTDDVDVPNYRAEIERQGLIDQVGIEYLKSARIIIGENGRRFPVYNCLSATVELHGSTYVHDERSWYRIPATILQYIHDQLDSIDLYARLVPPAGRVLEQRYNADTAIGNYLLLDRGTVALIPNQTPIEVCDLLTISSIDNRQMLDVIHVKRDFSSSTLSHLFAQGQVSAFALNDRSTRAAVRSRILDALERRIPKPSWSRRLRSMVSDASFNPGTVRVVYAILGDWGGRTITNRLPFFSKVSLVSAVHGLRGRGFEVALAQIQMDGPP